MNTSCFIVTCLLACLRACTLLGVSFSSTASVNEMTIITSCDGQEAREYSAVEIKRSSQ